MFWSNKPEEPKERPPPIGGGPLGLGDPNDRRLRKTESGIIIPKRLREAAQEKCSAELNTFLDCAKRTGLLVVFKCRKENKINDECMLKWIKNPDFVNEITEKYLAERSYYRRTGKPLNPYRKLPAKVQQPVDESS